GAEGIEPGAQKVAVDPEIGGDGVDRGSGDRLVQRDCVTLELLGVGLAWHGGKVPHFPSVMLVPACPPPRGQLQQSWWHRDRKSTRLNSSHVSISYAVFCLKKKTTRSISSVY